MKDDQSLNNRRAKRVRRRLFAESLERRELLAAGADIAFYPFTNNTSATPEFFSTDTHVETTASDITSPLFLGWTGNGEPPNGLALGGAFNETTEPSPAGGQPDYFELTITPDPGYDLSVARFSMQIRRNDPDSKNSYSVYFDNDPGAAGDNFTTKLTSGVITSEDVFESVAVDLEGIPALQNQTTPVTFRVYAWGTAGLSTMRLDNIRVQAEQTTTNESSQAYYGESGRLIHPLDGLGNRIADFSAAGYRNSNVPLPDVTATIDASRFVTVSPVAGDDMASIQAAIDQVGAMSLNADGYRGVVQLTAGEFQISNQVAILNSGVVLRGVGDGSDPATSTILRGTGTQQRSLVVVGASSGFASTVSGTTHNILDKYVPVGATSVRVDSTTNWNVGDAVVVDRQSTSNWISDIGMDMIPPRSDGGTTNQWSPGGNFDHLYERVITRIEGDRVFFNAPLLNSFEQQYGGGTIWRYTFSRIENVGIENIRGVSDFAHATDEAHARTFVELRAVQDAWVRNITGQHFIYATVHATIRSIRATVDDAQSLDPVSIITGARRYPFTIDGQFILMQNMYSEEGRHDFVNNSSWRNRGPNVFLNGTAVNSHSSTGPHQKWSSGTLYDTITTDNLIEARNRGNFGTGHGWAGANMVFWNNTASQFIVQNPPTSQNWVIGGTGTIVDETRFGPQPQGTYSEHNTPIDFQDASNPLNSLFVAQHNQRHAVPGSEKREYVLGDFDLGVYDGASSVDATPVDAGWMSEIVSLANGQPVEDLDQSTDGHFVPFSFDFLLDTHEVVQSAVVSIGVRSTGGDTTDDLIWTEDTSVPRTLSAIGVSDPITVSETTTLTFELTADELIHSRDGLLNFAVGQNLVVDWAVLDLSVLELTEFDFGDAPAPYPSSLADDGARHASTGPQLGATRDAEPNANTGPDAVGEVDDGVMFGVISLGNPLAAVNIELTNAPSAHVDAWIDFDGDGEWTEDEQILTAASVSAGLQTLNYSLPENASLGQTIARVRLSSTGELDPTGFWYDGEVEDLAVTIGEATAPTVESVLINDGESQRSNVERVTITFDSQVDAPPSAFSVVNLMGDVPVDLAVSSSVINNKTVAVLSFMPGASVASRINGMHSLRDGNYELVIDAAQITQAGVQMIDDFTFGNHQADGFFRYFGDTDGDGDVDARDFSRFGLTFLQDPNHPDFLAALDGDGDNDVDGRDYSRFRQRFHRSLPF